MKSRLLILLASGPKSDAELEVHFGASSMTEVKAVIGELSNWCLIRTKARQIHEGNNVFRWVSEYSIEREGEENESLQTYGAGFTEKLKKHHVQWNL